MHRQIKARSIKSVLLADEWEKFTLVLRVFHPFYNPNEVMKIYGTVPQMGGDKRIDKREMAAAGANKIKFDKHAAQPVKMFRSEHNQPWLFKKYGTDVRPWEF